MGTTQSTCEYPFGTLTSFSFKYNDFCDENKVYTTKAGKKVILHSGTNQLEVNLQTGDLHFNKVLLGPHEMTLKKITS
jgi:hypothetical protein